MYLFNHFVKTQTVLSTFQHLLSQQKDTDLEEYRKLLSEKEANTKRIQQMSEETGRLKAEIARYCKSQSVKRFMQNLIFIIKLHMEINFFHYFHVIIKFLIFLM